MKTLLITYSWRPWNSPGTFRWLQLGQYMNFDVFTTKEPSKGFYDSTLPKDVFERKVYRYGGYKLRRTLWSFLILRHLLKKRYDLYIFAVSPYGLYVTAFIMEKIFKRRVVVDIRDDFRKNARHKSHWLDWLFSYCQKRMNNKTCSFQFLDKDATRILSGYNPELVENIDIPFWVFIQEYRLGYEVYNNSLKMGDIPDYRNRINGKYGCSSFVNLLYLGFKDLPIDCLHEECINQPVQSWQESARQMKEYLLWTLST